MNKYNKGQEIEEIDDDLISTSDDIGIKAIIMKTMDRASNLITNSATPGKKSEFATLISYLQSMVEPFADDKYREDKNEILAKFKKEWTDGREKAWEKHKVNHPDLGSFKRTLKGDILNTFMVEKEAALFQKAMNMNKIIMELCDRKGLLLERVGATEVRLEDYAE